MSVGSAVPITILEEPEEKISPSLLDEEMQSSTCALINEVQENVPPAALNSIQPMKHTATSTENVASSNGRGKETDGVPAPTVPVKRRTKKIVPPTNCTRCKKSVKGQCV